MRIIKEALEKLSVVEPNIVKGDEKGPWWNPKRDLLDEDLRGWFKNNYLSKKVFGDVPEKKAYEMAAEVAKLDPTFKWSEGDSADDLLKKAQGAYFPWLMKLLKTGAVTYDEMMGHGHEYRDQLEIYNNLKKRNRLPSDKKDILNPHAGLNSLRELMDFMQNLGGESGEGDNAGAGPSDFRMELQDIRGFLCSLCRLEDRDIDPSVQKWEDIMEYVGGNDKWEIWNAKSFWATMLFDRWGKGAGWCVGGMLGNNYGIEQREQAKRYFSHYNSGGATYVCFQQKDKNAARPTNKYLITLGPDGEAPETSAGYQFNDASNSTVYSYPNSNQFRYDSRNSQQMDALASFLVINGLTQPFIKRFPRCVASQQLHNRKRIEAGEPYSYMGGEIPSSFKDVIDKIEFSLKDTGELVEVSAKEHPEYLNCQTVDDMEAMRDLFNGVPYVYDGLNIPEIIKSLISEVTLPDDYHIEVRFKEALYIGIRYGAFKGCVNLRKVTFPASVEVLDYGCFRVNGYNNPPADIELYTPKHKIKCYKDDVEWLTDHVHWE